MRGEPVGSRDARTHSADKQRDGNCIARSNVSFVRAAALLLLNSCAARGD